jgi:hypothetical protein
MAIVLVGMALYFGWRQRAAQQAMAFNTNVSREQRLYVLRQTQRRFFGSALLMVLAGLLIGSLFLDYDVLRRPINEVPLAEQEAAKEIVRLVSFYWMSFLLLLMALLALAVIDLWATARHGVQMQKKLFQEHQEMLKADLAEHRQRRAEMN